MPSGMLTEPSSEIPRPSGATCSAANAAASRVFFGTTEQLADKLAEADSSPLKQFGMTKNEGSVAQVTRPCSNRFQTRIFPQLVKECAGTEHRDPLAGLFSEEVTGSSCYATSPRKEFCNSHLGFTIGREIPSPEFRLPTMANRNFSSKARGTLLRAGR